MASPIRVNLTIRSDDAKHLHFDLATLATRRRSGLLRARLRQVGDGERVTTYGVPALLEEQQGDILVQLTFTESHPEFAQLAKCPPRMRAALLRTQLMSYYSATTVTADSASPVRNDAPEPEVSNAADDLVGAHLFATFIGAND